MKAKSRRNFDDECDERREDKTQHIRIKPENPRQHPCLAISPNLLDSSPK